MYVYLCVCICVGGPFASIPRSHTDRPQVTSAHHQSPTPHVTNRSSAWNTIFKIAQTNTRIIGLISPSIHPP